MKISKIDNFYFDNILINILETDLDENKSSFYLECNNFEKIDFSTNKSQQHYETLFCYDENGKKFTLYDCTVALKGKTRNIKQGFLVVYNKIIYGNHFEDLNELIIDKLEVIIDNTRLTYQIAIGRDNWELEDKTNILTEWNIENNKTKGVKIIVFPSDKQKNFLNCLNIFDNLLCIFYFNIGYFPNYKKISFYIGTKKYDFYNPNNSLFYTLDSINALMILNSQLNNMAEMYEKWVEFYNKNLILMHMYFDVQNSKGFEEVKTFNYIQCLESLYSNNFETKLFNDDKKEELKKVLENALNKNKRNKLLRKLERIFKNIRKNGYKYDINQFKNSLSGKLNDINKMSLYKKINMLYSLDYAKIIYKYEIDKAIIKKFKEKTYNHRNFIAHINNNSNYFKGKENIIAQQKFKLLFRVMVMNIIGMSIDINNLNNYVSFLNKWYEDNQF